MTTALPLRNSNNLVSIIHNPINGGVLGGVERGSVFWTMQIHHNHPTASKTTELFTTALKEKNFTQAALIIDAIEICSTRIASSTGREGVYEKVDARTLKHIAQQDSHLHTMLLGLYEKALMASK